MKNVSLVNSILVMLLLMSCVRSLYPLTENRNDIIYKKELLGVWKELKDGSEYIVDSNITAYGKNYKVTVLDHKSNTEKVDTGKFLAMLVNIKGHYFFGCYA